MSRRLVLGLAVVVVGVAALGLWRALSGGRAKFSMAELRDEPPIVLVMADVNRAGYARSGDLYVTRDGVTTLRRLRGWRPLTRLGPHESVYGTYAASWSPNRRQIGRASCRERGFAVV